MSNSQFYRAKQMLSVLNLRRVSNKSPAVESLKSSDQDENHDSTNTELETTRSDSLSCISQHMRVLRLCGVLRGQGSYHEAYRGFIFLLTTTYCLQQALFSYQNRTDMQRLSHVLFQLLCFITCIAKLIVFHTRADDIDRLLQLIKECDRGSVNNTGRSLLRACSQSSRRLLIWFPGAAVATCLLWTIQPLLQWRASLSVFFPLPSYLHYDTHGVAFGCVLLYSWMVTTWFGMSNCSMDALIAAMLYLFKTHVNIMRINLQRLPETALLEALRTGQPAVMVMKESLKRTVIHHLTIIKSLRLLEDIFSVPLLIQFTIGGWILCMSAYKMVTLKVVSVEFTSMILFVICILTELFIYCYYGSALTAESEEIRWSLSACEWWRGEKRFQRSLCLVAGCLTSLRPAAARVVPLSLSTFVSIMRSSYTFYTVLRQTK